MANFKNTFSWSQTRDNIFRECLRKYYYNYYGSWGGWEVVADLKIRELYILKQLKNRQMWAGERVHDCIERTIKNLHRKIEPVSLERAVEITINMMRSDFASSRKENYRSTPKTCALFEHEYSLPITNEQWRQNAEHVKTCLKNFYESDTYAMIRNLDPKDFFESEEFSSFEFEGTKINVKLDFSYRNEDKLFIYDWKTGKKQDQDNNIQLACYALYAKEKVNFSSVTTYQFNLASGTLCSFPFDSNIIEGVKDYMRGSIRDMLELLKDRGQNIAEEENFNKVEDPYICRYCNFQKVCSPDCSLSVSNGGSKL
jgi:CRISPR/Cas system-associated exonuclease Cas4 (RecB family)